MKIKKTHYEILGIETNVSAAQVKRAYRDLVKERHPDLHESKGDEEIRRSATEDMLEINEAYETLMDTISRANYDIKIGLRKNRITGKQAFTAISEDEAREKYLALYFFPARAGISRVLGKYKKNLRELSLDPFDDELLQVFQAYTDDVEKVLKKASDDLTYNPVPHSLKPAVLMMRHCIAQASDGLDEMRTFAMNFDYAHLNMAGNLFKISIDLSRQALDLSKTA